MSAKPLRAAVLGKPIGHSKSPLLHTAAYRLLGLDWEYGRFGVDAPELRDFLSGSSEEMVGYSLTMPLKEAAFELAAEVDESARATRACNTLVRRESEWVGYNTDVVGFERLLADSRFTSALLLGAGATARSAAVALDAVGVPNIAVASRRTEAALDLAESLGLPNVSTHPLDSELPEAELVVSTLPGDAELELRLPATSRALFDVVYSPWPTPLAAQASLRQLRIWSGLDLLVEQAAEQVLLMTGADASVRSDIVQAMRAALETAG